MASSVVSKRCHEGRTSSCVQREKIRFQQWFWHFTAMLQSNIIIPYTDWDMFLAGNPCQFTSLGTQADTFPSDRVPTAMLVRDTGVIRWLCCQFQQILIRAASAPWTATQSNATQGQPTDEALLFWIQPPSHSSPTHSTVLMKWSDHLKAQSLK